MDAIEGADGRKGVLMSDNVTCKAQVASLALQENLKKKKTPLKILAFASLLSNMVSLPSCI